MHAEPLQCAGVGLTLPKEEIEAQSKEPKHTQSRPSSKRLGQGSNRTTNQATRCPLDIPQNPVLPHSRGFWNYIPPRWPTFFPDGRVAQTYAPGKQLRQPLMANSRHEPLSPHLLSAHKGQPRAKDSGCHSSASRQSYPAAGWYENSHFGNKN